SLVAAFGTPPDAFSERIILKHEMPKGVQRLVKKLCDAIARSGNIWLIIPSPRNQNKLDFFQRPSFAQLQIANITPQELVTIWNSLTGRSGGGLEQHWLPETLDALLALWQPVHFPAVQLIPAIRKIGPKSEEFSDFSGRGLIDRLAQIQSPDHDK